MTVRRNSVIVDSTTSARHNCPYIVFGIVVVVVVVVAVITSSIAITVVVPVTVTIVTIVTVVTVVAVVAVTTTTVSVVTVVSVVTGVGVGGTVDPVIVLTAVACATLHTGTHISPFVSLTSVTMPSILRQRQWWWWWRWWCRQARCQR